MGLKMVDMITAAAQPAKQEESKPKEKPAQETPKKEEPKHEAPKQATKPKEVPMQEAVKKSPPNKSRSKVAATHLNPATPKGKRYGEKVPAAPLGHTFKKHEGIVGHTPGKHTSPLAQAKVGH